MFKTNVCRVGKTGYARMPRLAILIGLMVFMLALGGIFPYSSALANEDMFVKVAAE